MKKENRILDDLICIIAIVIFPMFILKLLGFDRFDLSEEKE